MNRLIALFAASALQCQAGLSDLEALSLIESGGNDHAVGSAGEVSRYQILPKVWRSYSQSRDYRSQWLSREVARLHLDNLRDGYQRHTGRSASDFDLYVMWNAGLGYYHRLSFNPGRVHRTIRERANRYVNLRRYSPTTVRASQDPSRWSSQLQLLSYADSSAAFASLR